MDIGRVTVGNSYFIERFCEGLEGEESDYAGCGGGGVGGDLVGKNAKTIM